MRSGSVAIVGFAPVTFEHAVDTLADEVWTMNHAYRIIPDERVISRLFDLHKIEYLDDENAGGGPEYWEWLQKPHKFPIYMQTEYPAIPASVRYPFEEVCADLFPGFVRGDEPIHYFTSSFSFMLAMAIHEGFQRVEIYGIEMGTNTEYIYQRDGAALMIGVALGRGMEIVLHPDSTLFKAKLYGYEDYQMVTRQTLEAYLRVYQQGFEQFKSEANALSASWNEYASISGDTGSPTAQAKFMDSQSAVARMHAYSGALQAIEKLIRESDLQVPDKDLEDIIALVEPSVMETV